MILICVVLLFLFFTTKENKVNDEGKSYVTFYESYLTKHSSSKVVTLEGHHYLHWTQHKKMSEHVNEFITVLSQN